ncbi:hypothetical protein [Streptomyces sp. enrichment culture]|uniref:hypothetical protein n=1 Tax=Streptomyces sp. enrichment culture TaxID=1795815 RepID=UPI003F57D50B
MRRDARVALALVLLPALLTACGSEKKGAADPAELGSRAGALGIAPQHVYALTPPSGFVLAQQSVGVHGDDGFSAVYFARESADRQIRLTVERGTMTDRTCPTALPSASGERAVCERDGDAWYRVTDQRREYALAKDGHVLRVSTEGDVPRAVLREAALGAHRPGAGELEALLPDAPAGAVPTERGDLPPNGDGAPVDPEGASG